MKRRTKAWRVIIVLFMLYFALGQLVVGAVIQDGDGDEAGGGGSPAISVMGASSASKNDRDHTQWQQGGSTVPVKKIDIKRGPSPVKTIKTELGGTSILLTADVKPSNASNRSVNWTSSNTSVAIVNAEGKVIVFGAGETTISATSKDGSGKSDSVVIKVGKRGSNYISKDILPEHNDGTKNTEQDFFGVNFINAQYSFGTGDAIQEAGERLRGLNTKSIKMYLSPNYKTYYKFNDWGNTTYQSPTELAQSSSFQKIFNMDFNTYFLGTYVFSEASYGLYWFNNFTDDQKQKEYDQMYELTTYLLNAYEGTGKTFILQNWEGDWSSLPAADPALDPEDGVLKRFTEYINIRQNAVNDAREASKSRDVHVYHAFEVNLLDKAMNGGKTVTNDMIPNTYCDYYSYSAYDTPIKGKEVFGAALDHLKAKVAQNLNNGKSRIFVGEFGIPENNSGTKLTMELIKTVMETAREKKIDHALFWQLYDDSGSPNLSDDKYMGYWLVKASGKKTAAWEYFYEYLNDGKHDPEYVPEPPPEYARPNIELGETNIEMGVKLVQAEDGATTVRTEGGRAGRTTTGTSPGGYMFFAADEDYVTAADRTLSIEVKYYDEGTAPLTLAYNSTTSSSSSLQLARTDTKAWKTYAFTLTDAAFARGLGGGAADFRLFDNGVPLLISAVTVSKPYQVENEVSILLKDYALQQGIMFKPLSHYDGDFKIETIGGKTAYATEPNKNVNGDWPNNNYLYFAVDSDVIPSTQEELYIDITYFDQGTTSFELQYNNTASDDPPYYAGIVAVVGASRTDTNEWKTYTFHITNAQFKRKFHSGFADFRFSDKGDKLYVSKIVIRKPQVSD